MNKVVVILMCIMLCAGCSEKVSNKESKKLDDNNMQENVVDNINSIEAIDNFIVEDSLNADLYVQRARVYLAKEQVGSAIKDINTALSVDRKNVDALLTLADIYYALGDEDNIMLTLNKASEYAPLDPRPIVKLSELSFLQGNPQLANAYIDKALELDRFNPRAYFMRGMIALSENDTAVAMKNFMTARVQKDDFIEPKIQIAHIYAAQGDTIAKSFFEEAIRMSPEDYSIYYDFAMYLQDNGFPYLALDYYDKLLEMMPNNPTFIYNKGYVYLVYLSENDRALDCFNKVLELDPSSVSALFNKGRTYEQMGDYINAKNIYRQILRDNPDYQLAVDAINRINE